MADGTGRKLVLLRHAKSAWPDRQSLTVKRDDHLGTEGPNASPFPRWSLRQGGYHGDDGDQGDEHVQQVGI